MCLIASGLAWIDPYSNSFPSEPVGPFTNIHSAYFILWSRLPLRPIVTGLRCNQYTLPAASHLDDLEALCTTPKPNSPSVLVAFAVHRQRRTAATFITLDLVALRRIDIPAKHIGLD